MNIIGTDKNGYTPEIIHLKCECGGRGFHTKNIDYIGARSIFDHKGGCEWMREQNRPCGCNGKLSIDEELMNHVKNCEECKRYGF